MTDTILAAITDEIGRQGPMTVETYMKRCLEPYYAAGNVIGVDGDFTTNDLVFVFTNGNYQGAAGATPIRSQLAGSVDGRGDGVQGSGRG